MSAVKQTLQKSVISAVKTVNGAGTFSIHRLERVKLPVGRCFMLLL